MKYLGILLLLVMGCGSDPEESPCQDRIGDELTVTFAYAEPYACEKGNAEECIAQTIGCPEMLPAQQLTIAPHDETYCEVHRHFSMSDGSFELNMFNNSHAPRDAWAVFHPGPDCGDVLPCASACIYDVEVIK